MAEEVDIEALQRELDDLRLEHRDLDDVIHRLQMTGGLEQLQLQRLKKRKLKLKDEIARIEDRLIPRSLADDEAAGTFLPALLAAIAHLDLGDPEEVAVLGRGSLGEDVVLTVHPAVLAAEALAAAKASGHLVEHLVFQLQRDLGIPLGV